MRTGSGTGTGLRVWASTYACAPREFWGLNADEWPGAERGTESQVAGFVGRLRESGRALVIVTPTVRDHDFGVVLATPKS